MSVGRLDFWNLTKEMTSFQLAVHQAAMAIEPVGEDRADMRMAMQTLAIVQAQRTKPMTSDEIESVFKGLLSYLPVHQEQKRSVTPDDAARQCKAAFARIGK